MSSPARLEDAVQTDVPSQGAAAQPTSASQSDDSDSDAAALDSSNAPSSQEPGRQLGPVASTPAHHKVLRHLSILSLLSFAAIWGTLTRLGLVALNTYDGQSIAPVIWAQGFGCFVMGWAVKNRSTIEAWYPPVYIALSTGYCGSVTTFSIWVLDVFRAFGNQRHYDRGGLHNVMDALTQTAATLAISLACLAAGKAFARLFPATHISSIIRRLVPFYSSQRSTSGSPSKAEAQTSSKFSTLGLDIFCIIFGLAFWIGSALLCALYDKASWREVTFSIIQAPPGAILRWYLSRYNTSSASKRGLHWPLGTLAANLIATLVVAASFVGQRVGRTPGSPTGIQALGCQALYGLEEGFCGCLSTISTFAVELQNLRPRKKAVGYAVGSWTLGVLICVVIVGAPWWSIGMDGSCVGITESSSA